MGGLIMKRTICNLIKLIKSDLIHDMQINKDVRNLVLCAYNHYQENERDGVDYLFDINNTDDLKCCIDGGMTTGEIAHIYFDVQAHHHTRFFFFGVNYKVPKFVPTNASLCTILEGSIDVVLLHVFAYPYANEAYKNLYSLCVTDYMVNEELI